MFTHLKNVFVALLILLNLITVIVDHVNRLKTVMYFYVEMLFNGTDKGVLNPFPGIVCINDLY